MCPRRIPSLHQNRPFCYSTTINRLTMIFAYNLWEHCFIFVMLVIYMCITKYQAQYGRKTKHNHQCVLCTSERSKIGKIWSIMCLLLCFLHQVPASPSLCLTHKHVYRHIPPFSLSTIDAIHLFPFSSIDASCLVHSIIFLILDRGVSIYGLTSVAEACSTEVWLWEDILRPVLATGVWAGEGWTPLSLTSSRYLNTSLRTELILYEIKCKQGKTRVRTFTLSAADSWVQ